MSLSLRILLPIFLVAIVSALGISWLALTSLNSAKLRTETANTSLEIVTRSGEMADRLRVAKSELRTVLKMTQLLETDQIWARIETQVNAISAGFDWMAQATQDEGLNAVVAESRLFLDDWVRDASVLLGQQSAAEIPTIEKIARAQTALVNALVGITEAARANADRASAQSLQDMRRMLAQTTVVLLLGLLAAIAFSMLVARGLSRDISSLAERLMKMADRSNEAEKNRNVLIMVRRAVETLEEALQERQALQERAREAEAERLETAQKEQERAEQERQRIAEESAAAAKRAEEQRRKAEQSSVLEGEISRVVEAASVGNLDARIDQKFDEKSLNDVAFGINALLVTVAESVSEAQSTQRQLASGDLTARFEGEHNGVFAQLQADINQTAQQFEEAMQQISVSSQTIFDDSTGISAAAEKLATRTETTASHTETTTRTVARVSSAANQMASNAKESSKLVESSMREVKSSESSMLKAMETIDEIAQYSEKISAVVGVINDIAFQTNLLALNAGVEAARAGNAGLGFAVVASEVRALAQRSSDSAKEIENLIKSSGECVEQGVVVVKQTGETLNTVAQSVAEISDRVFKIADEADSQSQEIQEVQKSLTEIERATQSNAAMFEETTAASQSLTNSAQGMAALAGRFKSQPDYRDERHSA